VERSQRSGGGEQRRGQALDVGSLVILAIFAAGTIVTAALAIPNRSVARDPAGVLYLLDFAAFLVVGALIVARRPDNAIGWLFSAVGLLALTLSLATEYTQYAYVTRPGALPGAILAAWYLAWGDSPCSSSRSPSPCCCFPPVASCRLAGDPSPG
jgi:ABC-type Na+ efflux pump permease subunit